MPNAGRALFVALAALVFVLDRLTKIAISATIPFGTERQVLPFLWLTNTHNSGAAFGVFQEGSLLVLFALGSVAVAIGIAYYVARTPVSLAVGATLGLIMGGTIGNGYDRLVNHTVVDFLDVHFWPVFNIADSAVSIGVVLLLVGYLVFPRRAA